MTARTDRLTLAAFIGCAILGGGNGVSVRFSNRELDPLWGCALRFAIAAVLLLAVMAVLRLELPRGRALAGAVLFGTLNFGLGYALIYTALVRLHGGVGALLLATGPLVTLLLAAAWRQERLTARAVVSTVPALAGVAALTWQASTGPISVVFVLAAIGSALCQSQAYVLVRGFPPVHPVTMNAIGLTVGTGLLLAGSALRGDAWVLPHVAATRLALAYLVLGGSIGVFLLYLAVLRHWPASRTSYVAVLMPFVTVVLSAWLDDEPIGIGLLVGGPLILAGVYFGALRRPPQPATATTTTPATATATATAE